MTAEDLSAELGVSTSHINQIEQGCRKMSVDLLYKLTDVLNVDANTLLAVPETVNGAFSISIDEELYELPQEQQKYFRNLFLQMIRRFPV